MRYTIATIHSHFLCFGLFYDIAENSFTYMIVNVLNSLNV